MLTRHATARAIRRSPMALVQRLPAQHREIIVATYFGGRTIREAAWVLGIAPAVARARLYQAMRDLSFMVAACRADHASCCCADRSGSK